MVVYDILRLRCANRMPHDMAYRVPGDEVLPEPQPGDRVVFTTQFSRGFAMPVSRFFRNFLDHFGIQPHHLGPNASMLLSTFATFCEGYLGMRPTVVLWTRLCHFRSQVVSVGKVITSCGAVSIYANQNVGHPSPKPLQSVKKWQQTFFYVRTPDANGDCHNLPDFVLDPLLRR